VHQPKAICANHVLIILDELNLIFYNTKMALPAYKFFAGNILKELKLMGPHNLSNLNKKNLKLEQLMCIPLYDANIITFWPD